MIASFFIFFSFLQKIFGSSFADFLGNSFNTFLASIGRYKNIARSDSLEPGITGAQSFRH